MSAAIDMLNNGTRKIIKTLARAKRLELQLANYMNDKTVQLNIKIYKQNATKGCVSYQKHQAAVEGFVEKLRKVRVRRQKIHKDLKLHPVGAGDEKKQLGRIESLTQDIDCICNKVDRVLSQLASQSKKPTFLY